jgi:hypothetical protein
VALFDRRDNEHQRETFSRGQPFISGQTVTSGRYRCAECGYEHHVPEGRVRSLPVCPRCQSERWSVTQVSAG